MLGRHREWNDYWPALGFRDLTRQFDELRRELDRAFDSGRNGQEIWPSVDVSDQGEAWELRAELPGISDKELELTVNAESVTIRAERKVDLPKGYAVHRRERAGFRLARTFNLPSKVEPDKVEATLKNGLLVVKLPKAPDAKPRQVQVRVS